jgi:hypothetical protein
MKYKSHGTLPPRTPDTMSEAIALSSPSGHMSKRARRAADRRLDAALFGDYQPATLVEDEKDNMLRRAAELRTLASRGMCVRKYTKEAEKLEALVKEVE